MKAQECAGWNFKTAQEPDHSPCSCPDVSPWHLPLGDSSSLAPGLPAHHPALTSTSLRTRAPSFPRPVRPNVVWSRLVHALAPCSSHTGLLAPSSAGALMPAVPSAQNETLCVLQAAAQIPLPQRGPSDRLPKPLLIVLHSWTQPLEASDEASRPPPPPRITFPTA